MIARQIAYSVLERIEYALLSRPLEIASWQHRRALVLKESECSWLSLKGVGWVHGPPWTCPSPKDDELYFGLLDNQSGGRELLVSKWLKKFDCRASQCVALVPLLSEEVAQLGMDDIPRFKNGRLIEPVVLITRSKSPLRVSDISPSCIHPWRNALIANFSRTKTSSPQQAREVVVNFARQLAKTIIRYQRLGAVNDTLAPDNVTIAGEITDFEWFYVPGIPLPDGSTDVIFTERQLKEAFYFIDVMVALCEGLDVRFSIFELAKFGLNQRESIFTAECGFERQLKVFIQ